MHIRRLIRMSRPRFWIYELGPYIIGIAAAIGADLSIWTSIPIVLFFIYFMYPANIYIYGINDIYDYETDKLNPKKVAYESLAMPEEHPAIWKHIVLVNAPWVIYAILILPLTSLLFLGLFLACAGWYSAPPIRAKARPILDSLFSAGHYVATAGFAYVLAHSIAGTTPSYTNLLIGSLGGLAWAIAMHAYSAVPDIKADTDAGLKTIATFFGAYKTVWLCAILYIVATIVAARYIGLMAWIGGFVYLWYMFLSLRRINRTDDTGLFKIYTYFPYINSIIGGILFWIIVLNLHL